MFAAADFEAVGLGVGEALGISVGEADVEIVGEAELLDVCELVVPRMTSPDISLSPIAIVTDALPLEVRRTSYIPDSAVALNLERKR